jgi:hypothetical protein
MKTVQKDKYLPESVKIKIGKNIFDADVDVLIASMTHQVIHKNNSLYNSEDFGLVFDITRAEVTSFLESNYDEGAEYFDLFEDWVSLFDEYQKNKNKLFCKDLIITFPDKTKWQVRILDVLSLRNKLSGDENSEVDLGDELLLDDQKLLAWIDENLSWEELSEYAEFLKETRQENTRKKNFQKAKKEIKQWSKQLSIFDFIQVGDMIISEDEDDDDED